MWVCLDVCIIVYAVGQARDAQKVHGLWYNLGQLVRSEFGLVRLRSGPVRET